MPKRFLKYSREEPARTILWSVSVLTGVTQTIAWLTGGAATFIVGLPNLLLVIALCGYGVWSTQRGHFKHMGKASFMMFVVWLWSGMARLAFSPDPGRFLWFPFLVVAVIMGTHPCSLNTRIFL